VPPPQIHRKPPEIRILRAGTTIAAIIAPKTLDPYTENKDHNV
jgi:hypothetical protein